MLQRLAAGEVSPQEALRLQQHLVRCPECARLTRDLKDAACLLRSGPAGGPGAAYAPAPLSPPPPGSVIHLGQTPIPSADAEYGFLAPPQGPGEMGRLGPYVVRRVLGTGGMGLVFEAEDPHLQRPVALKIMHAALAGSTSYRQRFLQEARAAAAIDHENIVTIYGAGEERGVLYLAMQFLRGATLEDRQRHEGRLPQAEVLRIGREVASGLAAAHERGLVHRDIKPANVWLEAGSGRVKILDFGLAWAPNSGGRLTRTGVVMGTPGYMAPEQARNKGPLDHRCDLFSLGCVLYEMCAGRLPFDTSDPVASLIALTTETPPAPHQLCADVHIGLSDLVMRLMAKSPSDRPATARVVAEELRRMEQNGHRPAAALPPTAPILRAAGASDRESELMACRTGKRNGSTAGRRLRDALLVAGTLLIAGGAALAVYHLGPQLSRVLAGGSAPVSEPEP
jgi:serine/threonine protein kinase